MQMQQVRFNSPLLQGDLSRKLIQFVNAKVLREGKIVWDQVWVRDGKIIDGAAVFYDEKRNPDIQVDCEGHILSPGFIDIQINGGFGVDFSTITSSVEEYKRGIDKVSRQLLSYGVTTFVPTVITSPPHVYSKVLPLLRRRDGSARGAGILGAHVEGPFISPEKKGCHPKQHIREFGNDAVKALLEVYGSTENIAIITIAPELENSEAAIRYMSEKGVLVSLGHSAAGLVAGERAVAAGARCITHLFNAMQSYHHRDPCLIGLLTSKMLGNRTMYYGIISDGIHTHDSALRLAHRTNPEGLIVITDGIAALGMGDGVHKLGDCVVNVNGLHAILEGTETTAGSVASMPYCIKHFAKAARCGLEEALICATEKPATLMGIQGCKGSISIGLDADLVLITEGVDILATYIGGNLVYANKHM
ncbi:hypothetical protein RB195_008782 [Necator americanus]|uniref:N-acetylglucosamine-6-phosphate deacetylase n=1 Tax=Necator americanus TaxID=51031 RepID=A0ABR1CR16_NECAM